MEFQVWMQWLIPLLSAVLAGSGVWTLLAARTTARATVRAADASAQPAAAAALTADWAGLMGYWQQEMTALRADANRLEVRVMFLERQREEDLQLINELEAHIWSELPPPPPSRRRPPTQPAP
jgi:ubiquinone biosynthesis protein UbiJ